MWRFGFEFRLELLRVVVGISSIALFRLVPFFPTERQIFLTRHGESEDNINGIIGGDAPLSPLGKKFGAALARFIRCQRINFIQEQSRRWRNESLSQYGHHLSVNGAIRSGATTKGNATPTGIPGNASNLSVGGKSGLSVHEEQLSQIPFTVWTSMLKRTVETVEEFDAAEYDIKHIRFLNEIYSGICEGLTYREIQEKFPGEFNARQQNKLYYRYPGMGGESYLGSFYHAIIEVFWLNVYPKI
ncbi:histidine phosphatase superfamily [Jimgerdemannia flammicorona]|uniref:Histidine phosphatase superfamily n=1 Tax=Jimgerdemannia flammicorona TaxID=994334 RepID=A0A432ZYS3_9FUNG|nr:histidine phosphatase superfamily [Jimgerdemannia flammicorona]